MLPWLSITVLAISHGLYLVPFAKAIRQSQLPLPVDFVGLSAIAYFDLGMLFECLGFRYNSEFFAPFFEAPQLHIVFAVILIATAPWLIRLTSGSSSDRQLNTESKVHLRCGWPRVVFYSFAGAVCLLSIALPLSLLTVGPHMWESRFVLGELLGPWIILLSLPMYLIGFYVRLRDAESRSGKLTTNVLLASSVLATIAVGERTLVLLPFLIVLLFGQKFSWRRWVTVAIIGAVAAALMLPIFKPSYESSSDSTAQLLADTISNDFYRAPELAHTLEISSTFGTRTLQYTGAGYVYAALFFVPRALAPFKGDSTAQDFTGAVMNRDPNALDWGFGISAISEALLNVGIVLTPLMLMAYGVAIGWLTRKSMQWSSLEVPLCLASLWLFGYHLPALLLNFGAMALVGVICERLFTNRVGKSLALVIEYSPSKAAKGQIL